MDQPTLDKEQLADYITKKVAAAEIVKYLVKIRNIGIVSIVAVMFIAVVASLSLVAGAFSAGILAIGFAWIIWQDLKKLKELKYNYGLQ